MGFLLLFMGFGAAFWAIARGNILAGLALLVVVISGLIWVLKELGVPEKLAENIAFALPIAAGIAFCSFFIGFIFIGAIDEDNCLLWGYGLAALSFVVSFIFLVSLPNDPENEFHQNNVQPVIQGDPEQVWTLCPRSVEDERGRVVDWVFEHCLK